MDTQWICKWQASFPPDRLWVCAGADPTDLRGPARKTEAKEEPESNTGQEGFAKPCVIVLMNSCGYLLLSC